MAIRISIEPSDRTQFTKPITQFISHCQAAEGPAVPVRARDNVLHPAFDDIYHHRALGPFLSVIN